MRSKKGFFIATLGLFVSVAVVTGYIMRGQASIVVSSFKLVNKGAISLKLGAIDPGELRKLTVDHQGNVYSSYDTRFLKFNSSGSLVSDTDIGLYNLKYLVDWCLDESGSVFLIGHSNALSPTDPATNVVKLNHQGKLLHSINVRGIAPETIAIGLRGEVMVGGTHRPNANATIDDARAGKVFLKRALYKIDDNGNELGSLNETTYNAIDHPKKTPKLYSANLGRQLVVLESNMQGISLRVVSLSGNDDGPRKLDLPVTSTASIDAMLKEMRDVESEQYLDQIFPLGENKILLTRGTGFRGSMENGDRHSISAYEAFVVFLDERVVSKISQGLTGVVKDVGRDGYIYLSSIKFESGVRKDLQLTKAVIEW